MMWPKEHERCSAMDAKRQVTGEVRQLSAEWFELAWIQKKVYESQSRNSKK